jgi:hypothetical protein
MTDGYAGRTDGCAGMMEGCVGRTVNIAEVQITFRQLKIVIHQCSALKNLAKIRTFIYDIHTTNRFVMISF